MAAQSLSAPFRVSCGDTFRLSAVDPASTGDLAPAKKEAKVALEDGVRQLSELQQTLYAQGQWGVILLFQAMDAAGKDGTIKHVMSGVNPQGCQVTSFKAPSSLELSHDYLWRVNRCLPERGRIGIFNRSYYEETLVVRVHQDLLARQALPAGLVTPGIWQQRFQEIRHYEAYLGANGFLVRKFFLHLSKAEQKRRFQERLTNPQKHWKFSAADLAERAFWDDYMQAYEEMIRATATEQAPWYVIPADHKWFTRLVVASAVIESLQSLDLHTPTMTEPEQRALEEARRRLEAEPD
jgi:PPK2 family polyphosphate:nucleotide phosphotransferase